MKILIQNLKSSKLINKLYVFIGSLLINFIKLFIKTDKYLLLFVSFGGKQYNDSPKAIYEAMQNQDRFNKYKFVWALTEPHKYDIPGNAKVVKIDTLKYFLLTLKARAWISNSPIERRLDYKGKNNLYFCTWHGTPIKKIGDEFSNTSSVNYGNSKYDLITAQSEYEVSIFREAFKISDNKIIRCGLPRNDKLKKADYNSSEYYKRKLDLPCDKKIILYCPTFRDWEGDSFTLEVNWEKWKKHLGENYIVLFRAHAKVSKNIQNINISDFVYNVSNYDELNELMIASDLLITDYSSLSIDYSILEKPIFCYTYDYEKYNNNRGMYFDIREYLAGGSISEDSLLDLINNSSYIENIKLVKKFRENFVDYYGKATEISTDIIYSKL